MSKLTGEFVIEIEVKRQEEGAVTHKVQCYPGHSRIETVIGQSMVVKVELGDQQSRGLIRLSKSGVGEVFESWASECLTVGDGFKDMLRAHLNEGFGELEATNRYLDEFFDGEGQIEVARLAAAIIEKPSLAEQLGKMEVVVGKEFERSVSMFSGKSGELLQHLSQLARRPLDMLFGSGDKFRFELDPHSTLVRGPFCDYAREVLGEQVLGVLQAEVVKLFKQHDEGIGASYGQLQESTKRVEEYVVKTRREFALFGEELGVAARDLADKAQMLKAAGFEVELNKAVEALPEEESSELPAPGPAADRVA